MPIPENDTQLWKGFDGHGLYAKRTERDRDGAVIDTDYARKSELHALSNTLSESTTTELTPNAAKDAIDGIRKAPTPGNEGTMLSYGVNQASMAWESWESDEYDVPQLLPEHCVLLDYLIDGYHLGQQPDRGYENYPPVTGFAPNENSKQGFNYFDFAGAPFDRMPYAYFNNTSGTYSWAENLLWTGFNNTKYPDGITVEFLARVDNGTYFAQFAEVINAYNFAGLSSGSSSVGSYMVSGSSASYNYGIGSLSNVLTTYNVADAWHHYCYTADFKNQKGYFFLDGILVRTTTNRLTSGTLAFNPCCISTNNGTSKVPYGYYLAQVAVWDYPKYTASFTIPRKPLLAL